MQSVISSQSSSSLSRIVSAVRAIQDPTVGNDERKNAQIFIDSWKDERYHTELRGEILQTALQLIQQYIDDEYVQHFGLSTVAEYIKEEWDNLRDKERNELQEMSIEILRACIQFFSRTNMIKHFIKEKVAEIIVGLAKRSWPQEWPDMLERILGFIPQQIGKDNQFEYFVAVDVVALILMTLSEEVSTYNQDLPRQRRSELHSSLNLFLSSYIIPFFVQNLDTLYAAWTDIPIGAPLKDVGLVLSSFLHSLSAFLDWISYELIFSYKFVDALCLLMVKGLDSRNRDAEKVGARALDCLLMLFSRKPIPDDVEEMTVANYTFVEAVSRLAASGFNFTSVGSYSSVKKIGHCLCQIGSTWLHRESANPHSIRLNSNGKASPVAGMSSLDILRLFFQVLVDFTKHPSIFVISFTLPVFSHILRNNGLSAVRNVMLDSFYKDICALLVRLFHRHGQLRSEFDAQDFVTEKEFVKFVSQLKSSITTIWRYICTQQPAKSSEYVIEGFRQLFSQRDSFSRDRDSLNDWISHYESVTGLLDVYLGCVSKDDYDPKVMEIFQYVLSDVDTSNSIHPAVLLQHFVILSSVRHVIPLNDMIIPSLLEKIFAIAFTYISPENGGVAHLGELSLESVTVRRKASSCLLRTITGSSWAGGIEHLFFPYVEMMAVKFQESFDSLLHSDRVQIIESIVAILNKMEDHAAQSHILSSILLPVINVWLETEVNASLESSDTFMAFVGVSDAISHEMQKRRKSLLVPMQIFSAILRRFDFGDKTNIEVLNSSNNPFQSMIQVVYNNLFRLIRILHELPSYDAANVVRTSIISISAHEISLLTGDEYPSEGVDLGSFLFVLRAASYDLLANFLYLPMIYSEDPNTSLVMFLNGSVFQNAEFMTFSHLRQWVHHFFFSFIINFYNRGDTDRNGNYAQFLCYGTSIILQTLFKTINAEFERKEQAEDRESAMTDSLASSAEANEEAIEDRLLSKLVRELFDVLAKLARYGRDPGYNAYKTKAYKAHKSHKMKDFSEQFLYLLSSEACGQVILLILLNGLAWPVGGSFRKAIQVCNKLLVSPYARDPRIVKALGNVEQEMILHGVRSMLLITNRSKKFNDERFHEEMLELSTLVSNAASRLANSNSELMMNVLAQFPKVDQSARAELLRTLHSHPYEKEAQKAFQQFLDISLSISFSDRKATILDIPQKLFLEKINKNQDPILSIAEGTIKDLFVPSAPVSAEESTTTSPK